MCGRYSLHATGAALSEQFQLAEIPTMTPRYNIAPTQNVAIVRMTETGRRLALVRWGLIPSWAGDSTKGARMINARAETAAEKPAFRTAFKQRRCLVPATGFFEWQGKGKKLPFYFHMRDGRSFAFAGLWEAWNSHDGLVETCAILTTTANELVQPIHERMPVILEADAYSLWLDPTIRDPEPLQNLLQPYIASAMQTYSVHTLVNSPFHDAPECIAPLA